MDEATVEAFRAFAGAATVMLAARPSSPASTSELTAGKFEAFIAAAKPLVTASVRSYLKWFEPHARRFRPLSDDLLGVAGYTNVENSYSRLAAWVLGHNNPSPLAAAVQARWLAQIHPHQPPTRALSVHLEFQTTTSGTPDLVLVGGDMVVVVEAKTGTREHEAAQTGLFQTEAYLPAVRETLKLASDFPGFTVFLTLKADEPAHTDAFVSTFAELAFAILEVIDGEKGEVAWPYRALASHWLVHTMPGTDMYKVVRMALDQANIDDRTLVAGLHTISSLERMVPFRGAAR